MVLLLVFSVALRWFPARHWSGTRRRAGRRARPPDAAGSLAGRCCAPGTCAARAGEHRRGRGGPYVRPPGCVALHRVGSCAATCCATPTVPATSALGVQLQFLLGGLVVVELLFNYPGIGALLLQSAVNKDLPTLQATAMVLGSLYMSGPVGRRSRTGCWIRVRAAWLRVAMTVVLHRRRRGGRGLAARGRPRGAARRAPVGSVAAVFCDRGPCWCRTTRRLQVHAQRFRPPGGAYWLGTDQFGRDVFAAAVRRRAPGVAGRAACHGARCRVWYGPGTGCWHGRGVGSTTSSCEFSTR